MPWSCEAVFVVLLYGFDDGPARVSVRTLAASCRLSPTQTRRALRRLEAVRLIRWHRNPGTVGVVVLRWRSYPQATEPPGPRIRARIPLPRDELCFAKSRGGSRFPSKAHRWAIARLRDELTPADYPNLSPGERGRLIASAAATLARGLRSGAISPGRSLALAVVELRRSFADRWRIGTPAELHRAAAGCVSTAAKTWQAEHRATAAMLVGFAELERQRAEAIADPLGRWLEAEGVGSVAQMICTMSGPLSSGGLDAQK